MKSSAYLTSKIYLDLLKNISVSKNLELIQNFRS